jgi:hypothetical protein
MLSFIQKRLGNLVRSTWAEEMRHYGTLTQLFRDYYEGNHRARLEPEMKALLRVSGDELDQFNINYCSTVVETMADRLTVTTIEGGTVNASEWAADVLDFNRIDGLQMDVHEAALRDGVTYVMVAYDNERRMPVIAHELAWDGDVGMIAVKDRTGKQIVAAVKVWYEGDEKRVNLYLPDGVEKYRWANGALTPVEERADWVTRTGAPIGVPIVEFGNRRSELAAVIPMQDALNRTLVSMVMTGELTAFQIRIALGFDPPKKVTPGMWVVIGKDGLSKDQLVDAKVLPQGQLVPFINQAEFLINQIATVSRTPIPALSGGDNSSGEALKQREIGLLGKIKRFQVRGGNRWEDVMSMAARLQGAFGTMAAPASGRWWTRWEDAELRNDSEIIDNAGKVRELVGDRETLRLVANVYDYDDTDIDRILAERAEQTAGALNALLASQPRFDALGAGVDGL